MPRTKQCRRTRANGSTSAKVATRSCAQNRAIVVCSARSVRCRALQSRPVATKLAAAPKRRGHSTSATSSGRSGWGARTLTTKGIIALDADGVLLDYGLAYASAWQKAFGTYPGERDPLAYWPIDRWEVERVEGDRLDLLRRAFDNEFWSSIPPVPGAIEACHKLAAAGYELVCVTALPAEFRAAREHNLRLHGFPIHLVHATDNVATAASPKADTLNSLKPIAFVDDYLPYFVGVDAAIHRALILRGITGSPNAGDLMVHTDSHHADLLAFANWWSQRAGDKCR